MNSIAQIEYSQLNVGPMRNMSYIIWNPTSKNCFLVDPAWDAPLINEELIFAPDAKSVTSSP